MSEQSENHGESQGEKEMGKQLQKKEPKLPHHAILHCLRAHIERNHRDNIFRHPVRFFGPASVSLASIPKLWMVQIEACCNRSLPIYIWPDKSLSRGSWPLLPIVLHNYLYRTWYVDFRAKTAVGQERVPPPFDFQSGWLTRWARFRPYRSEIDWNQFLAQVIRIKEDPAGPALLVTDEPVKVARVATSISRVLCAHIETVQQKIGDRPNHTTTYSEMEALRGELGFEDWHPIGIRNQKFLLLQPLFRAVAIVIKSADYTTAVPAIAEIPVLIVLTGVEDGLSAPITFDPIADRIRTHHQIEDSIQVAETSLATAVSFAMDLEKREVSAFGPRPDPAETCKESRRSFLLCDGEALMLARGDGWEGEEAPEGPSSSWVDLSIYPYWTGDGAEYDEGEAQTWEVRCCKLAMAAERGEDPYDAPPQTHPDVYD